MSLRVGANARIVARPFTENVERPTPNAQCRMQKLCIFAGWMFGVGRSAFSFS